MKTLSGNTCADMIAKAARPIGAPPEIARKFTQENNRETNAR